MLVNLLVVALPLPTGEDQSLSPGETGRATYPVSEVPEGVLLWVEVVVPGGAAGEVEDAAEAGHQALRGRRRPCLQEQHLPLPYLRQSCSQDATRRAPAHCRAQGKGKGQEGAERVGQARYEMKEEVRGESR